MKQCPACDELFDENMKFCELDGTPLVDQATDIREILHPLPYQTSPSIPVAMVVVGILLGVILSLVGYMLFLFPSANNRVAQKRESVTPTSIARPELVSAPRERQNPAPLESPSPEETTEEPSPAPSPVASSSPVPTMNNGPISTGTKRGPESGQALIKMKDGTSLEADAAWEDAQGVWYRRGNMVAFVDRSRVEKITAISTNAPAASEDPRP